MISERESSLRDKDKNSPVSPTLTDARAGKMIASFRCSENWGAARKTVHETSRRAFFFAHCFPRYAPTNRWTRGTFRAEK